MIREKEQKRQGGKPGDRAESQEIEGRPGGHPGDRVKNQELEENSRDRG